MAGTVTKVSGPTVIPGGGGGVEYEFSIALITSTTANGEPIDLTAYFSYFYGASVEGVDAAADATWTFQIVGPGRAVACASDNVLVTATHGSGADAVNNHADAEDLSTVGALMIRARGKPVITTSWA